VSAFPLLGLLFQVVGFLTVVLWFVSQACPKIEAIVDHVFDLATHVRGRYRRYRRRR